MRKIELEAYSAFMKATAVTGMSWVSHRATINPDFPKRDSLSPFFPPSFPSVGSKVILIFNFQRELLVRYVHK